MKALKEYVEKVIGMPLSFILPKDKELFPLDDEDPDKAYLFASEEGRQRSFLIQGHIIPFIQECPEGYFMVGHWGYGLNSYAFYYSRTDAWSKIFFRLPIGGVYVDNKREAKRIREFFPKFFEFENYLEGRAKLFIAIDSMWDGLYRVLFMNGNALELKETLFDNPNFNLIKRKGKPIDGKHILLF